jgi:hypothetical protein
VARTKYFSLLRTARTRASARVRARAWLSVRLSMDVFSSNLRWTYCKSHQVAWATYFSCSCTACERARGYTLTYLRTDFLQMCWAYTTNDHKLHELHMYHLHAPRTRDRARVCERARAWFSVHLSLDGFSSNLLGTHYTSPQVAWVTYCSWRVCVIACPNSTNQYTFANSDTYDT